MERKKVYVTRQIPEKALSLLKEYFEVEVNDQEKILSKEELLIKVRGADGLLCLLTDIIDRDIMSAGRLKIIANYAVGYNNIDIEEAESRGIIVTNTPDVLTDATADIAWALLFSAARRVVEADKYTRAGNFKMWSPLLMLGQEITGKTLGIIGAGRIGRAFAKRSLGFNMNIIYSGRIRNESFESETGARYVDIKTLLTESDFISLHVPLTNETFHLIDEKEFNLMKQTAVLINTSRGPVINEKSLVKALKNRRIWAAGLDVYEFEPIIEEELTNMDNVVLLPHIGSATFETREKMAIMAAENIIEVLNGRKAINPVKR